jgi:uncharacterized membrane protein YhfC
MNVLGMGNWKEAKGIELFIFAVVFGLAAGVCEEGSLYLVYRYLLAASDAHVDRRWKAAVSLGAGHGGCEAIMLGVIVLSTLIKMNELRHADLSKLLEPEQLLEAQEKLDWYWSMPWYELFMLAVDRVSVMMYHMEYVVVGSRHCLPRYHGCH